MLEQVADVRTGTEVVVRGRLGVGGDLGEVHVRDGRVVSVGPIGHADAASAEVLDPGDATVLPGLVDAHVHVDQWAHRSTRVDVAGTRSPAEVADRLRRHLLAHPDSPRRVLVGHGFVDGLWDEPIHRSVLDDALGVTPVAVISSDLHTIWLNGAALDAVGHPGHPTGVLREGPATAVIAGLQAAEPETVVDGWVDDVLATLPARGVTRLADFEFADNVAAWRRRTAAGEPVVRVDTAIWPEWLEEAIASELRTGDPVAGDRVRVGPFKVVADGSLNTRTAWCFDHYPGAADGPEAAGLSLVDAAGLTDLVSRASAAGLVPAVHAIGDRANALALDVFERVGCGGRIEHAQLVRPEDLARFARLGVIASVQPQHAMADREVADRHWTGRTPYAFPYGSLLAAGARLELGSDAPVSPPDPWLSIADAVYRTDDDRPPWHPEQRIPLEAAVTAAAGGRRVVVAGDEADLTIVPGDLRDAGRDELRTMPVLATMVGGRFTHRAV